MTRGDGAKKSLGVVVMLASDEAWYRDVRVLFRRPGEFFPGRDQSPEERLNSLVRLIAYCSLAAWAWSRKPRYLGFGLAAAAAVSLAFRGPGGARAPAVVEREPTVGGVRVRGVGRGRPRCTPSTPDNPFANMLLTDDPTRAPACKYDDQAELVRTNFNRGLVRNSYDLYEKENNQSRWTTNPVTTGAPDVAAFVNFCYGGMRQTCKESPAKCTGSHP